MEESDGGSEPTVPGWYQDPLGVHQLRRWDNGWTDDAADAQVPGTQTPTAEPEQPKAADPRNRSRKPLVVAAIALVLLAVGGALVLLLSSVSFGGSTSPASLAATSPQVVQYDEFAESRLPELTVEERRDLAHELCANISEADGYETWTQQERAENVARHRSDREAYYEWVGAAIEAFCPDYLAAYSLPASSLTTTTHLRTTTTVDAFARATQRLFIDQLIRIDARYALRSESYLIALARQVCSANRQSGMGGIEQTMLENEALLPSGTLELFAGTATGYFCPL